MATADEAISMVQKLLEIAGQQDNAPVGVAAVYHSPSTMMRIQADEMDRKEALYASARQLVREHR